METNIKNIKLKVTDATNINDINAGWLDSEGKFTSWEEMTPDHIQKAYNSIRMREFQSHNRMVMFCNMADLILDKAKNRNITLKNPKTKAVKGVFGSYFTRKN